MQSFHPEFPSNQSNQSLPKLQGNKNLQALQQSEFPCTAEKARVCRPTFVQSLPENDNSSFSSLELETEKIESKVHKPESSNIDQKAPVDPKILQERIENLQVQDFHGRTETRKSGTRFPNSSDSIKTSSSKGSFRSDVGGK